MRVLSIIFLLVLIACNPSQKPKTVTIQSDEVIDSLKNYDPHVKAIFPSYGKELLGRWQLVYMKRQQKLPQEFLENVLVEFKSDSSFSGKAPCNGMNGSYSLKGSSIRFNDVIVTDMACDNIAVEAAFLKLLTATVAAFNIQSDTLFLRDVSGAVVLLGKFSP